MWMAKEYEIIKCLVVLGSVFVICLAPLSTYVLQIVSCYSTISSSPFGIPYYVHIQNWWNDNMGMDSKNNLKQNALANPCPQNQTGPVLFFQIKSRLGILKLHVRSRLERHCFFRLREGLHGMILHLMEDIIRIMSLSDIARECLPGAAFRMSVDGEEVDSLSLSENITETPVFNVTIHENSVCECKLPA